MRRQETQRLANAVDSVSNRRIVAALTAVLALSLVFLPACSREDSTSTSEYDGRLVAAYMADEAITEDDVTDYISEYRSAVNLTDDQAWAEYLSSTNETAQSYREKTVNQLAIDRLFDKTAKESGIRIDNEAVQQGLDTVRASYNATDDETWKTVLDALGMSEENIRESYEKQNLKDQVYERAVPREDATDEDIAAYIDSYLLNTQAFDLLRLEGTYYLPTQNELVRIQQSSSPLAAFESAQLNDDASSEKYLMRNDIGWVLADGSGDVWLDVMEGSSIPGLRESLYFDGKTQQILYASEKFTFSDGAKDLSSMPQKLKETIGAEAEAKAWNEACTQWLRDQLAAQLTINDAPMHLPYDVQ